jgi:Xaa-Pro aminopeptidase
VVRNFLAVRIVREMASLDKGPARLQTSGGPSVASDATHNPLSTTEIALMSDPTTLERPRFEPLGFSRERFAGAAAEQGLAGVLLTSPENVFYTTGYTVLPSAGNPILYTLRSRLPAFAYVDADGTVTLLCWGFSAQGVEFGVDEVIGFDRYGQALEALEALLRGARAGSLGVESTCPRFVLQTIERAGRAGDVADADGLIARLRLIKSAAEIAALRRSTELIERTVAELYGLLEPGMSRLALMNEARTRMIANGATGISHITFAFARQNPEFAIDEPLDPGRLATLDLGAIVDGYCSDNRRYAYAGDIPASLVERYDRMVEIVDGVGAALVPGTSYAEVFARAGELCAERDIQLLGRKTHVGHHIGLETEEEWIDDDPTKSIRPNMVINIELYSTAETGEQIGDEETYVIGEDGPERVTVLPREIHRV